MPPEPEFESTPLAALVAALRNPAMLVAGGKDLQREAAAVFRNYGIRIITNEDHGFPVADMETGKISLGWVFCERLWAYVFAHMTIWEWDERAGRPKSVREFFRDPATLGARNLLAWACRCERAKVRLCWPKDLPRPTPPPEPMIPVSYHGLEWMLGETQPDPLIGRANRVFLYATGYFVMHEAAHLIDQHSAQVPPDIVAYGQFMNQEQAADHFAAIRVSGSGTPGRDAMEDPLLGIISALVALASAFLEPLYRNADARGDLHHVDPMTRLRRALRTFFPDNPKICRAAALFLEMHLRAQGMATPKDLELGSDEHLCRVFELIGGHVLHQRASPGGNDPARDSGPT